MNEYEKDAEDKSYPRYGFVEDICEVLNEELPTYQRRGNGGTYSYVKGEDVVRQLNKAFNHGWSSEVIKDEEKYNQVLILVSLTVFVGGDTIVHHGFGSAPIAKHTKTGEILDIGNTYKSAYTTALKKAAEQFGIGLNSSDGGDLSGGTSSYKKHPAPNKGVQPRQQVRPSVSRPSLTPPSGLSKPRPSLTPPSNSPAPAASSSSPPIASLVAAEKGGSLTDIQKNAIGNLANSKGYTTEEIIALALEKKVDIDDLSSAEAVQVIRFAGSSSKKGV